ncbi:MAG: DUF1887 family protein [Methanotrichaceae archaeon]|nr:DUF1887 family protein [Methanotrichaceae archaeon]
MVEGLPAGCGLEEKNSIEATIELLGNLFSKYSDAEWIVNITGGTKPMSIGAFEFFESKIAKILYVPIIGQNRAINFADGSFIELRYRLKIKEFLAGYGFSYFKKDEIILKGERRAKELFELAVNLSANIDGTHKMMNDLDIKFEELFKEDVETARSKARDKGITLVNLEIQDERMRNLISDSFGLSDNGGNLNGKLDRHAVQFLTGGWLEAFIWGVLSKYSDDLSIFDVRLGIHPGKKIDKNASIKEVKNDWDIAFMYDQSLRFVECKTGDQEQDPSGNETLYKVEAVKKQLGALNIKSYLATTSPNVLNGSNIRDAIADRARLYNCIIIPSLKIQSLALMEIKRDPEIVNKLSQAFTINKAVTK